MKTQIAQPGSVIVSRPPGNQAILPWIEHLAKLFPIGQAIVVGAGNGATPWIRFLKESAAQFVTLVEADETAFKHLSHNAADRRCWTLCHQLIGPDRGRCSFYRTSVASENGLLDLECLGDLWPRISVRETMELDAIPLRDIVDRLQSPADWLFIDCLPAGPIIESADEHLSKVNVVVARTAENISFESANRKNLVTAMQGHGFQLLAYEANRNPKTGHVLMIRKLGSALKEEVNSLGDKIRALECAKKDEADALRDRIRTLETENREWELKFKQIDFESVVASYESAISDLEGILSDALRRHSCQEARLREIQSMCSLLSEYFSKSKKSK